MADKKQFGKSKILRFAERRANPMRGDQRACAECEAWLTDAVDGLLNPEEQARFDRHVAQCVMCSEHLAEARRGAAWLEALRTPVPEPSAELLNRILTATATAGCTETPRAALAAQSNVLPFRRRLAALLRESPLVQIALQPRLAMTAAMAFFSIALTLNLTGVRPQDLRMSELRTGSLQRDFFQTKARAAQFVTGLRVVHVMESRVRDLRSDGEDEAPSQFAPGTFPPAQLQPSPARPGSTQPSRPSGTRQPAPNSGTSRRKETEQRRLLIAGGPENRGDRRIGNSAADRLEGGLA